MSLPERYRVRDSRRVQERCKVKLSLKKQKDAATENENHVVDKVVENAQMDIPEPMIDSQVNNMVNDYARRMQSQGLSLEQYMQFTGMTIETLKEQMKPQAVKEDSDQTRIRSDREG